MILRCTMTRRTKLLSALRRELKISDGLVRRLKPLDAFRVNGESAHTNRILMPGDEVTVTFTGTSDYACDVFGYSYVGGEGNSDALNFTDYTGSFSGSVGGFDKIAISGKTAMTLAAAADDVSNTAWEFDFTERASGLASTAALDWDEAFTEHTTVAVTFADGAQARGAWSIAAVADASNATFDLTVGDDVIAEGLAYGAGIASGDYAGWGFTTESGVLKFKNLA